MKLETRGPARPGHGWRARAPRILAVLGMLFAAMLASLLVGVMVGAILEQKGVGHYTEALTASRFARKVVDPALRSARAVLVHGENMPWNWIRGLAEVDVPRVVIDMEHLEYQKLAGKRAEALELGLLFSEPGDYVKARISIDGESVKGKLRLKGDLPDHYESDKWSLRIRLQGDATLLGMKTFSIQNPATRNFMGEWVMLEAFRREDILAPRYRFVDVTINGRHMGIYALEEHFEKRLVESSARREGPILKLDEDLFWRSMALRSDRSPAYGDYAAATVQGWAAENGHGSVFERAVALLEAFRRGELRTTDVFDAERLATYLALRDLGGAEGTVWQNQRFYHNPVTSKLEPIAFDNEVDPGYRIDRLFGASGGVSVKSEFHGEDEPGSLMRRMFEDPAFTALYVRALERVSDPSYLESLLHDIQPDFERELRILFRDYPYYSSWSDDFLWDNQSFIRGSLDAPTGLIAYHEKGEGDTTTLRLGNILTLPVEVLGVSVASERRDLDRPLVLPPRGHRAAVDYRPHAFRIGAPAAGSLRVHYRILGSPRERGAPVMGWSQQLAAAVEGGWLTERTDPASLPFLVRDPATGGFAIQPGHWILRDTVVLRIPGPLQAGPGVRLDLRDGAKWVVHAPIRFLGTEEDPVVVTSADATGQGFAVMQAGARSMLRHVRFDNLGEPREAGWLLPGAVTFYESPASFEHVAFRRSRSEDALNIFRSEFVMRETAFVETGGDAFDGDFVEGEILDSSFTDIGNDAIDVSGSSVAVADVRMRRVGDKGISVGENSQLMAHGVRIEGSGVGVAAKDLSSVELDDVLVADARIGFAAFQKKTEFGSASIDMRSVTLADVEREFLIEHGSRASLDGSQIEARYQEVAEDLYGTGSGVDLARPF